jgi:hypothetical protein
MRIGRATKATAILIGSAPFPNRLVPLFRERADSLERTRTGPDGETTITGNQGLHRKCTTEKYRTAVVRRMQERCSRAQAARPLQRRPSAVASKQSCEKRRARNSA